jgi:hypothetical protein
MTPGEPTTTHQKHVEASLVLVLSVQIREAEAGLRQLSIEELRAVVGGPVIQNDNT